MQFLADHQVPRPDEGFLRGVQRDLYLGAEGQALTLGFPLTPTPAAPHGIENAAFVLGVIPDHTASAGPADDSVFEGQLRRGHGLPGLAALYLQLRKVPDLLGYDGGNAVLQIVLGQLALVGNFFVGNRINMECFLKQAVSHVFLIGQHVHHSAVEPHIVAPPGGDAVRIQPLGNLLIIQAIQKLGVDTPDDRRFSFIHRQFAPSLAVAIEIGKSEALHAALFISAPLAPFDVLGHILRFRLRQRCHEGQHQFTLRRAGVESLFLEIHINAQASQLAGI